MSSLERSNRCEALLQTNLLVYAVLTVAAWSGLTLAIVGTSEPLRALAGGTVLLVLIAVLSFGIPSSIAVAVLAPARRRIDGARFFCLAAPIMVLAAVPMLVAEPGFHAPLVATVQIGVQILAAVAMTVLRPSTDTSISVAVDERDSERLAPVRRDSRS